MIGFFVVEGVGGLLCIQCCQVSYHFMWGTRKRSSPTMEDSLGYTMREIEDG